MAIIQQKPAERKPLSQRVKEFMQMTVLSAGIMLSSCLSQPPETKVDTSCAPPGLVLITEKYSCSKINSSKPISEECNASQLESSKMAAQNDYFPSHCHLNIDITDINPEENSVNYTVKSTSENNPPEITYSSNNTINAVYTAKNEDYTTRTTCDIQIANIGYTLKSLEVQVDNEKYTLIKGKEIELPAIDGGTVKVELKSGLYDIHNELVIAHINVIKGSEEHLYRISKKVSDISTELIGEYIPGVKSTLADFKVCE